MMIPLPLYPLTHYLEKTSLLSEVGLPPKLSNKKRIFSKGKLNLYQGERIKKFPVLAVKGMHLYHYDFGIAYPQEQYLYPLFFYQVIIAPKRVLALVHYPFYQREALTTQKGIPALLEADLQHSELLIKEFKPQSFLEGDVINNKFNGLIRTTDIDKAYGAIADLFVQWYRGLSEQEKTTDTAIINSQHQWTKDFAAKFYQQDYGFISTKRYMGEPWTKNVFDQYLFNV